MCVCFERDARGEMHPICGFFKCGDEPDVANRRTKYSAMMLGSLSTFSSPLVATHPLAWYLAAHKPARRSNPCMTAPAKSHAQWFEGECPITKSMAPERSPMRRVEIESAMTKQQLATRDVRHARQGQTGFPGFKSTLG